MSGQRDSWGIDLGKILYHSRAILRPAGIITRLSEEHLDVRRLETSFLDFGPGFEGESIT